MLVSLTIVRYSKSKIPLALLAMALHRIPFLLNIGCSFYKLLGCGKNGSFDKQADLQQWGLLAVWDTEAHFQRFYGKSFISKWWKIFCQESYTILCEPISSHGYWDSKQPFGKTQNEMYSGPVAVLTRATIRFEKLKNFWAHVDTVARLMQKSAGYIASFGIGEVPLIKQATFSLWTSIEDVKAFAYQSAEHADVIKKTRAENWYSEELFARFKPIASFGTINGKNPLKTYLETDESSSRIAPPRL